MFSLKKEKDITWYNWSESVHCRVEKIVEPSTLEELITVVNQCRQEGKSIRVVGAGHSFTPLVATSDRMISLRYLKGIESIDRKQDIVTVWGGTTLKDLGKRLYEKGYAMENLGDINAQTIAGAISTGTHGTGQELGNIPTQVVGLTLLTAAGELCHISATENKHLLQAAKVSLGMLGIIIKVELKVLPAYVLIAHSYRLSLDECVKQMEGLKKANRNIEFYWFPYTQTVQVKTMNLHMDQTISKQKKNKFNEIVIENGLLWALSEVSKRIPKMTKAVSTLSALGVPVGTEINTSHLLYTTPRLVKFQEMEYCVPEEVLGDILKEMDHMIRKKKIKVHFPIECRFVKKDDIWMSPSYERNSAYIAVHMYKGIAFNEYFSAMEKIFQHYGGRPHWGKMHSMTCEQLYTLYPKLPSFLAVCQELDEDGTFTNAYLRDLLGI